METTRIKLSQFAKQQGLTYTTAYRAWQKGQIVGIKLPTGTILVSGWADGSDTHTELNNVVIYSRVSRPKDVNFLREQTVALKEFVQANEGYNLIDVVEEVAHGFNDHRTKLLSLMYRTDWDTLVIENRDQLMMFSYPYVEALLRRNNQEIVVVSDSHEGAALVESKLTASGETQLINLISKTTAVLKTMIAVPSKKQLEQIIQNLLK